MENTPQQLVDTIELLEERLAELEFAQEDSGWERLGGDSQYEFSFHGLLKIVARSRLFFLHNPLINRAVTLQSDYVFAQGVNIQAANDDVNKVVQAFLDDKQNQREITGHQARLLKEQTLMLDGNVFLVLFTDQQNTGKVSIRSILVDEIVEIITNPDDQNEVWFYKRQWTSRKTNFKSGVTGAEVEYAYYPDIDYLPKLFDKRKTIDKIKVYWDAPIYHIKVGSLSKSRYGVPEVYPALDWAKAHRNFLQDWVTIVRAYARFAFNLEVKGGKNAVVAARNKINTTVTQGAPVERNSPALPGSTFVAAKDGATLEPIKTAGATTSAEDGREIRMMVAAAVGMPDTFFGDVDVGNLATARTLDRPTELKFRSRQTLWQEAMISILNYVVKWAALAQNGPLHNNSVFKINNDGQLEFSTETSTGEDTHIAVVFPPILEHSITDRIEAIANAVTLNGRSFAVNSPALAKLTMELMLQALGKADVDEVVKSIYADIDKQAKEDEQLKKQMSKANSDGTLNDPQKDKDSHDATGSKPPGPNNRDRQVYS